MILIFASIYDLAFQARGVISWALRHPRPAVSGLTPRATSLQILSCGRYEQSVHALTPRNGCRHAHSRKAFKLPYYAELGPAN
jgi:hypothetical protein